MFKVLRIVKLAIRLLRRRSRTQKQQRRTSDGGRRRRRGARDGLRPAAALTHKKLRPSLEGGTTTNRPHRAARGTA